MNHVTNLVLRASMNRLRARSLIYLGSMFTSNGRYVQVIRRRIGIEKLASTLLEKVLKSRDIKLQLRIRVFK